MEANRLLKNAPAYRSRSRPRAGQAGICPALCGIALILPRVKHGAGSLRGIPVGNGFKPFPTKDFEGPRKRDFAKLNLHLGIFEQP